MRGPFSALGIVNLMDHNLTRPQYIVVLIFLNALHCITSQLVILFSVAVERHRVRTIARYDYPSQLVLRPRKIRRPRGGSGHYLSEDARHVSDRPDFTVCPTHAAEWSRPVYSPRAQTAAHSRATAPTKAESVVIEQLVVRGMVLPYLRARPARNLVASPAAASIKALLPSNGRSIPGSCRPTCAAVRPKASG